jgi:drug/metabolite transporter (DMT)-like permease
MVTELQIAIISGIFAMVGWGLADFFTKMTVDKIDDFRTYFWTNITGMLQILFYLIFNFQIPDLTFQTILYILTISLLPTFGILLYFRGLSKGKATVISPVYSTYAAFAVLISFLIFNETIVGITWLGLGIVFLGTLLASFDYNEFRKIDFELRDLTRGIKETLLAALLIGIYFPIWDRFLAREGWMILLLLGYIFSFAILMGISFLKKKKLKIKNKKLWKWFFIIGFLNTIAFFFVIGGFKRTTYTSIISVISATSPIIVITLARIFLREKISLTQKLGIVLVLIGLVIISL